MDFFFFPYLVMNLLSGVKSPRSAPRFFSFLLGGVRQSGFCLRVLIVSSSWPRLFPLLSSFKRLRI